MLPTGSDNPLRRGAWATMRPHHTIIEGTSVKRARLAFVAVLTVVVLGACARTAALHVRFEPASAPLTALEAETLAATTDIGSVSSMGTNEAPAVRTAMLNELRGKGPAGAHAARLLTSGFPTSTASIPVLVRICSFEGTSAVVVVEAFGDPGGKLTHRRLWVFASASDSVIRAASFR